MIPFLKLFQTTAFKLSVIYSIAFGLAAAVIVFHAGAEVQQVLEEQISDAIDADLRGLTDSYEQGGIKGVVDSIERRVAEASGDLYLITTFTGDPIIGNIASIPTAALNAPGLVEVDYQPERGAKKPRRALARLSVLSGGFRLLVGHDIEEREYLKRILRHSLASTLGWLILFGAIGGLIMARRVLIRVDAISASARAIMAGDLTGRLPSNGSGDELDRLAANLNAMLSRIESLMADMQEMSDNVAHDLRTPLTRIRNYAESAIKNGSDSTAPVEALRGVLAEADGLIKIFDALLLIARAESGSDPFQEIIDVSSIVADIAELYEASVEERAGQMTTMIAPGLYIKGSRELLAQALANLLDNALKYGVEPGQSPNISLSLRASGEYVVISIGDRGPGVGAQDRERIKQRFVRLEQSRSLPGSGLGLSLVAAIVHWLKGRLNIEDHQPGLRVELMFPIARPRPYHASHVV